jgi:chromosomal replication initiator protein
MANAKFKVAEEGPAVVSLVELRRQRALEEMERQRLEAEKRDAKLMEDLARANFSIREANYALARHLAHVASPSKIIRRISRAMRVPVIEIMGESRNKKVVLARQACVYWMCRQTLYSLPRIGSFIGGKDHTTVLHAKRTYVAKRAKMGRTLREVR